MTRLDVALVERGLVASRSRAQALIAAGGVQVDGSVATKPAEQVGPDAHLQVADAGWVSRAAHKLMGALDDARLRVPARVLDAGASTGGFTQVALDRGAQVVFAVDVGHGQLAPIIRDDPRVEVREGLNLRDLTLADLDGSPVDLVVADVSFISLTLILGPMLSVLSSSGDALVLVKPQFEVGRSRLGHGGVVRDPRDRAWAIDRVLEAAQALGWREQWRGDSRLPGESGNVEAFVHLRR